MRSRALRAAVILVLLAPLPLAARPLASPTIGIHSAVGAYGRAPDLMTTVGFLGTVDVQLSSSFHVGPAFGLEHDLYKSGFGLNSTVVGFGTVLGARWTILPPADLPKLCLLAGWGVWTGGVSPPIGTLPENLYHTFVFRMALMAPTPYPVSVGGGLGFRAGGHSVVPGSPPGGGYFAGGYLIVEFGRPTVERPDVVVEPNY